MSEDIQPRLEDVCAENERLRLQVAALQAECESHAERYRDVESQNTSLTSLYVASHRLHGTLDRDEVLIVIQEIVTNLVGCEEIAIFERQEADGPLALAAFTGIDGGVLATAPPDGVIGWCARQARTFVSGAADDHVVRTREEGHLSACVPLLLSGQVSGAIALFRLLPQKRSLEPLDHDLFDLLATQAASALHCARLHAGQSPVAS